MGQQEIGQVITSHLKKFVVDLKKNVVKQGEVVQPDMTMFDRANPDFTFCKVTRIDFLGALMNVKGLKRFLAKMSPEDLSTKVTMKIDDLDGDNKPDKLDQYFVSAKFPIPKVPEVKMCGKEQWDVVKMKYNPFLYVFHFSTGGFAVIESMAYLLEAQILKK